MSEIIPPAPNSLPPLSFLLPSLSEEILDKVKDSAGVYIVPAFSGLYAPYWKHDAQGYVAMETTLATCQFEYHCIVQKSIP